MKTKLGTEVIFSACFLHLAHSREPSVITGSGGTEPPGSHLPSFLIFLSRGEACERSSRSYGDERKGNALSWDKWQKQRVRGRRLKSIHFINHGCRCGTEPPPSGNHVYNFASQEHAASLRKHGHWRLNLTLWWLDRQPTVLRALCSGHPCWTASALMLPTALPSLWKDFSNTNVDFIKCFCSMPQSKENISDFTSQDTS